jgi:hypothetical protein
MAGAIVSVTQIVHGTGLFLLVPIADLVENRKLVLTPLGLTILSLLGVATFVNIGVFFVASFLIGVCATGTQVLLPFVAHLVPEVRRGRVTGKIMADVLTKIMLVSTRSGCSRWPGPEVRWQRRGPGRSPTAGGRSSRLLVRWS